MFLVWFLLGIFVGAVVGVSCTYAYLDCKFQKAVKGVLGGIQDELARFADE